jgi:peptide/nickel transport system permease protein
MTPKDTPNPMTRLGLVLPGAGHLLTGDWLVGVGLITLVGQLFWAAAAGFPRIGSVVFPIAPGAHVSQTSTHGAVSVAAWVAIAVALWWTAWRKAFPIPYDPATFNSNWNVFKRQFQRNRTGLLGLFGVLVLVTFTLLTPLIAPFDPDMIGVADKELAPTWSHLLGTDTYGRDLFSRVLYGSRISLSIGFIAVGIAASIGVTVGAVAGYVGGWTDRIMMWFVDLLLSLPSLVLLLALVGLFRTSGAESIFLIVTILGFTGWMGVSRIVRSQILSLKEQDFIQAARALGYSTTRIVFRHLIPNAIAPVIVYCSLAVGGIIVAEAGLSFLGLGVSPPTSTWGTLVNDGREPIRTAPWIATFPGLCIVAAVMSFNLLGDGLRDALDPKLRGR